MQFLITSIDFDFEDDDFELPPTEQESLIKEVMSTIWKASDPDDLVEEITCATGFCIKSIDYKHVLK